MEVESAIMANRISSASGVSTLRRSEIIIIGAACLAGLSACWLTGCRDPLPSKTTSVSAGNHYYWRAEYVAAIGQYKSALEHDASDPEVLYRIGQCYSFLGDYREAIYWYDRALASFPGHKGAASALEEAEQVLAQSSALARPGPGALPPLPPQPAPLSPRLRAERLIEVARTYEANNEPERALANYQRAVEVADNLAFTHAELGRFYMRTGRNDDAIRELQQARRLNPSEPGVASDLAKLGAN